MYGHKMAREAATQEWIARGVIDTFRDAGPVSTLGTTWRAYSDRVLGGQSEAWARFEVFDAKPCVRLGGRVVARDGEDGAVQASLGLGRGGQAYDASGFFGVRFFARSHTTGTFSVHLREVGSSSPWRYWRATFEVEDRWTPVAVPFSRFEPVGAARAIQRGQLGQLALVASGVDLDVELAVSSLSFF